MLELEHGFRIVDSQVQLEPERNRRRRGEGGPEQIERELHQAGVVRALTMPGDRQGSYLKANNGVARMAVDRPFHAVARVKGVRDPGGGTGSRIINLTQSRSEEHTSPDDIEQYAYEDRFVAFMLNPQSDGLPDGEVLRRLEDVDMPVLTYGGRGFPPERIEATLLSYNFPLILSHFGGYSLDRSQMLDGIELLDQHDNCYLETSYVRFRDPLEKAIMEHPSRVVFGSGAPSFHPNVAVMEILTLDIPQDAMRKVFSKNISRVIDAVAR